MRSFAQEKLRNNDLVAQDDERYLKVRFEDRLNDLEFMNSTDKYE